MAANGRISNADSPTGQGAERYDAMVARATALIPVLRERASRTEELRRLPAETERDLHDSGLFRILQPGRVGGSEFDYVALVDCADALGQADASWRGILPTLQATTGCWECSIGKHRMRSGRKTPVR